MPYVLVRKCVLLFQLGIRRASIVNLYALLYGCMHAWIYRIDTRIEYLIMVTVQKILHVIKRNDVTKNM